MEFGFNQIMDRVETKVTCGDITREETTMKRIVVLSDEETWEILNPNTQIVEVSNRGLRKLEEGFKLKWLSEKEAKTLYRIEDLLMAESPERKGGT